MSLPRLGSLLYLDSPVRQPDGAGGFIESWLELGALWCEVLLRSGGEGVQGTAPSTSVSYKISVRAAPMGHPQRPMAGQRFRHDTRMFNIRAVAERGGDGAFLVCYADEEVVV